jgi:hypothetical protein
MHGQRMLSTQPGQEQVLTAPYGSIRPWSRKTCSLSRMGKETNSCLSRLYGPICTRTTHPIKSLSTVPTNFSIVKKADLPINNIRVTSTLYIYTDLPNKFLKGNLNAKQVCTTRHVQWLYNDQYIVELPKWYPQHDTRLISHKDSQHNAAC